MQIAIVLYQGLTALDAIGPYEVFNFLPEVEIRFVSNAVEPIFADSGVLVLGATHTFAETLSPDIVLVPGSSTSTMDAMANKNLTSWLKKVHHSTQLTLSVCSGALVLAAAGILEGHKATTHWVAQDILNNMGALAQRDKRVVKSGKIMTGAGVSAGIDLSLSAVIELFGKQRAEIIQLLLEYDPHPPVNSGHVTKASKGVFEQAFQEMKQTTKRGIRANAVVKVLWQQTLNSIRKRFV